MNTDATPTTLYRLYDESGDLLYVGISVRPFQRVKEHRGDKEWWTQVASQTFTHYHTRDEAADAELEAIRTEHPRYNKAGRADWRKEKAALAAEREAWWRLELLVPRANQLVMLAQDIGIADRSRNFCANAYWYGYRINGEPQLSLRAVCNAIVGRHAIYSYDHLKPDDRAFVTGWGEAHGVLYKRAYRELPDCRHWDVGNGNCHSHQGRMTTHEILSMNTMAFYDLPLAHAVRGAA